MKKKLNYQPGTKTQVSILLKTTKGLIIALIAIFLLGIILSPFNMENLWLSFLVVFALPFIAGVLLFVWIVTMTAPGLIVAIKSIFVGKSLQKPSNSQKGTIFRISAFILSFFTIVLWSIGLFILGHFILSGGPNKRIDSHFFGNRQDPYLDMKVSIWLITVGGVLSLAHKTIYGLDKRQTKVAI